MASFSDHEKLRVALQGRGAVARYPFPGAEDVEVGVKLLSDRELDGIRLRAVEYVKTKKADLLLDPEFLDRTIQRETVACAFVDPDKPSHAFFASQEEVASLDNLTVRTLYELYIAHGQAMDPYAFCPPEEIEELIAALGKSDSSAARMSLFDAPTLRSCVLSMARMLRERSLPPK
jgi:hypothetical protein